MALVVIVAAAVVAVVVTTGDDDGDDTAGEETTSSTTDETSAEGSESSPSSPSTSTSTTAKEIALALPEGWDENDAVVELWKTILTQKGYQVSTKQLATDVVFPAIAAGEIDVFLDVWMPNSRDSLKPFKNDIEDLGAWYDKTKNTITVPTYMKNVNTVGDLRKVAGDLKKTVIGIDPGSMNDHAENKVLPDYGLDGWSVEPSPGRTMPAKLQQAIKDREPIAVLLWRPHWAYHGMPIKDLRDPKGLVSSKGKIHAMARQGFSTDHPEIAAAMKRFHLGPQVMAQLEWLVLKKHENNPEAGAREWLKKHPQFVSQLGL